MVARLWMYRCAMSNWGIAVFRCRSVRAEALVAAVVPADDSLRRRVWLRLVGSFAEYTVSSMVVEQIAGIGEKVRRSCGGVAVRVGYDWTCTQCGWGGRLVRAGHSTCSKCEWQCLSWCEAAARIETADDEIGEKLGRSWGLRLDVYSVWLGRTFSQSWALHLQ